MGKRESEEEGCVSVSADVILFLLFLPEVWEAGRGRMRLACDGMGSEACGEVGLGGFGLCGAA